MNKFDMELVKLIRMRVGVARGEPTEEQLQEIKAELAAISKLGKEITNEILVEVARRYCKPGPYMVLDSVDNSDLHTILMLALNATPKL